VIGGSAAAAWVARVDTRAVRIVLADEIVRAGDTEPTGDVDDVTMSEDGQSRHLTLVPSPLPDCCAIHLPH